MDTHPDDFHPVCDFCHIPHGTFGLAFVELGELRICQFCAKKRRPKYDKEYQALWLLHESWKAKD